MEKNTSKRITSLRFILIVLVVFIHNNISGITNTPITGNIKIICSETIARAAVPLFFLISGYLLFIKAQPYGTVIRKKAKTLLLPYLFWNALELLMFFVGQNLPGISHLFTNENNMVSQYTWQQWIASFVGLESGYPIAYQFWFIRDLMLVTLCYPLVKWLIDRLPLTTLGGMLILWLMDIQIGYVSGEAILFFYLGYYIVKYGVSIEKVDQIRLRDIGVAYILLIALRTVLFAVLPEQMIVYKLTIAVGCLFWLRLTAVFITKEKLYGRLAALSGYAFFVYAFHEPFLTLLRKVWDKVFMTQSTAGLLIQYFGLVAVIILLALGIAWCLKKLMPKFYALITGGRA